MRLQIFTSFFLALIIATGCSKRASVSSTTTSPSSSTRGGSGNGTITPGMITAAEWNDADNWSFWTNAVQQDVFRSMPAYWSMYNSNRVSVSVEDSAGNPQADAEVTLQLAGFVVFTARTDNRGRAELWPNLYQSSTAANFTDAMLMVKNSAGTLVASVPAKPYADGINKIIATVTPPPANIEIAFMVDATGSMGDELEYLKTELQDVITHAKAANSGTTIRTGSVFYRDQGDQYITRISPFSEDINNTMSFIREQSAGGGGDFPEAVHTALTRSVNELSWSAGARTRLLFLVLDAPPHHETGVISELQRAITTAAEKGIKIIPVTASGIDKETEYLMRAMALSTNGTYVFITDDSGIGNSHLEATVGQYQVEQLNDLLVRLINKYAK